MKRKLHLCTILALTLFVQALSGQMPTAPEPTAPQRTTTPQPSTPPRGDNTAPTDSIELIFPDDPNDGGAASFGSDETISVDFPDEEIRTILRNVADLYDLNLVIPETLQGNTSLKLRNVTWDEVFDVILEPIGFTYVVDRNIIKVRSLQDLEAEPMDTRVFLINYAEAGALQESVGILIDTAAGGRIQVDTRSNALVITERPSRMNRIQEIIERLDRPTEQVMIESKFIEVTNRDAKNIGVNWSSLSGFGLQAGPFSSSVNRSSNQSGTNNRSQTDTDAPFINSALARGSQITGVGGNLSYPSVFEVVQTGVDGMGNPIEQVIQTFPGIGGSSSDGFDRTVTKTSGETAVFSADAFNVVLSALETLDDVKLVSNPTVVTLNNTEALISIGERFPVPQYTYNEERGIFEVSGFDYTDIGINLNVTPQVNTAGFINLNIRPEVSTRQGTVSFGGASGAEIPIIGSRRTESSITIKDGFTLAIGGLVESQESVGQSKVPILGDIPGLGRLFKSDTKDTNQRNLIIFITARTLNPDGSTYEEIIDPRVLNDMGISPRDVPGYRVPESERASLEAIRQRRMQFLESDAREELQKVLDILQSDNPGAALNTRLP